MIFLNKINEDLIRHQIVTTEISVGSEIISRFKKDGVVLLKNLISDRWQDLLKEAIEKDINNPGPHYHAYETEGGKGHFHGCMRIWEHNNGFRDYCLKSPLPSFATQLLQY